MDVNFVGVGKTSLISVFVTGDKKAWHVSLVPSPSSPTLLSHDQSGRKKGRINTRERACIIE